MASPPPIPRVVGRYELHSEIASGGMASVHLGRLIGPVGFNRTVAIKRLHPHLARDPVFVSMFVDEARLAARIHHTNVVSTLDVVTADGELFLVMEYVQGESLAGLLERSAARREPPPPEIIGTIVAGVLHGLHAAHEAKDENGNPLAIVHRDVSPQNIMVGADGVARVFDFGIAKAAVRIQATQEGQLKGKLCYMAPEQLNGGEVGRRTDIYAASVVLWEALTGERLFDAENEGLIVDKIRLGFVPPPSTLVPGLPTALDDVVLRGLDLSASARFASAREMAREVERCLALRPAADVGEWVEAMAGDVLDVRAEAVARIERAGGVTMPRRRRAVYVPLAAALVGLSVVSIAVVGRYRAQTRSPEPLASSTTASAAASAPSAVSLPAARDLPREPPVTEPKPSRPPSVGSPRRPAPLAADSGLAGDADRCKPPYTRDLGGRKIYKRECL